MRVLALGVASAALFVCGVPAASAQSHPSDWAGWHVDVGVATTSGQTTGDAAYNPLDLSPSGRVAEIGGGYNFVVADHVILGVDAGIEFGSVEATASRESCNIADCGFDETETATKSSAIALRLGGSIGHQVGPVLVSVFGGVQVGDFTRSYTYDVAGQPSYTFEESGYRAGYDYGLSAEYLVNRSLSVGVVWKRAELTELEVGNTGGYIADAVYASETFSVKASLRL